MIQRTYELLKDCTLCPRNCHADRISGQTGYCGQTAEIRVARAALHAWEEPCISGTAGSGAVFFSGCPLRCAFCQNHEIAIGRAGKEISTGRLAEIFLELQEKGANNINLVTPTHFVPQIAEALGEAKSKGMRLPVVYNTSSYEKVSTLKLLDGLVDIYLPDLKYVSAELSRCLSNAPDYFETAGAAIAEMLRQVGEPVFLSPDGRLLNARQMNEACGEAGEETCGGAAGGCRSGAFEDSDFLMQKGVIVRHLVLPGQAEDSARVLSWLYRTFGDRIYISIMNQYTPMPGIGKWMEQKRRAGEASRLFAEMDRKLSEKEYEALVDYAIDLGVDNGFLQEGNTAEESFIPAFDGEGV